MPWCLFSGSETGILAELSPVVTSELGLGLCFLMAGISDIDRYNQLGRKQFLHRTCIVHSVEQCALLRQLFKVQPGAVGHSTIGLPVKF